MKSEPMRVSRTKVVGFRIVERNVYMFRPVRDEGEREMIRLIPRIKPPRALRLTRGTR